MDLEGHFLGKGTDVSLKHAISTATMNILREEYTGCPETTDPWFTFLGCMCFYSEIVHRIHI